MSFHLYTGNRLEKLSEALAQQLSVRPVDGPAPLQPDIVVAGSLGMGAWLQQQLTAHMPIVANLRFPFINALLDFVLLHTDGRPPRWQELDEAETDQFSRELLHWRIFDLLGSIDSAGADEEFKPLLNYFSPDDGLGELKRCQLAEQLANLYDRYQLYRPSWLAAWDGRCPGLCLPGGPPPELGDEQQWQAALWQRVRDGAGEARPRHEQLASFTANSANLRDRGIHRLFLFCVGALPPLQLQFIEALSRAVPVHLFVLAPCSTYWFEDRRPRQAEREAQDLRDKGIADPSPFIETGNPLLTSLGVVGQEFLRRINDEVGGAGHVNLDDQTWMTPPAGPGLLMAIQRDIYYRRAADQPPDSEEAPPLTEDWSRIADDDDSIVINSCHSEQREVEVLRDWLLRFFDAAHETAADADGQPREVSRLKPRQVLVMAPDISRYLPYIESVFDRKAKGADSYIPYSIADRTATGESLVVNAFLQLLRLPQARFDAPAIMDLLAVAPIARAFDIDTGSIEKLRSWVDESGIRWGLSAGHRESVLAPAEPSEGEGTPLPDGHVGTWEFGLDRMLLGYAMDDDQGDLFADTIAPFGEVEGGAASHVGRLAHLIGSLANLRETLGGTCTAEAWSVKLAAVLDEFFAGDNESYLEIYLIRRGLEKLAATAAAVDATSTFGIRVALQYVRTALEGEFVGGGFCRGKVTFCSMLPMRSVPADVVCLLGMSDGEFPRSDRAAGFDLTSGPGQRRQGDRSRRFDDRYMFLEALLAARQKLYISYLGRDIQENTQLPPSVLVSELRDYVGDHLNAAGATALAESLPQTTDQRLQGFNSAYFETPSNDAESPPPGRLFSYSTGTCTAALALQQARRTEPRRYALFAQVHAASEVELLPELEEDSPLRTVSIEALIRFYRNPVEYLLRNRLNIYLREDTAQLRGSESFDPPVLEKYQINQAILGKQLGMPPPTTEDVHKQLMAQGLLPHGVSGRNWFKKQWQDVGSYLDREVTASGRTVRDFLETPPTERRRLSSSLPDNSCTLTGGLELHDDIHFRGRFGSLRATDRFDAWVRHLLLCAKGNNCRTVFLGKGKKKSKTTNLYEPASLSPDIAQTRLNTLLTLYLRGLRQPLMLVPSASWAYVKANGAGDGLEKANAAWLGSFNSVAYDGVLDTAFRFCWGTGPLDGWVTERFAAMAAADEADNTDEAIAAFDVNLAADEVNLAAFDEVAWLVFDPLRKDGQR